MAIRRPTNYNATADIIADLEDMADSIQDELDLKVDKVQGKGLSTNDYTKEEKEKLSGIEEEANKTVVDVSLDETSENPLQNKAIYAELAEKQEQIDGLIEENSTLKKQIPTEHISTTSIQLTDSAEDLPIEHVKIKGATEQVQYTGANMYNMAVDYPRNQNAMSVTQIDGKYIYTAIGTGYVFAQKNMELEPGTYSYKFIGNGTSSNYVVLKGQNPLSNPFTLTETASIGFRVLISSANVGDSVTLEKITLCTGNTPTDEPYTGGQASPNPDFPQDIHRVTGNCNEKVQNRNLANIEKLELLVGSTGVVSSSANTWNCIVDTRKIDSLYISGDFSLLSDNVLRVGGFNEYPAINSQGTRLTYSANVSMNTTNYDYVLFCFLISSGSTIDDVKNSFLIEIGNTASSYVPHAEQNAPLSLGNIEAYEGDEIQIDYVQKAGYKKVTGARFVKQYKKLVLNGSEHWGVRVTSKYTSQIATNLPPTKRTGETFDGYCNYYRTIGNWDASPDKTALVYKNASWNYANVQIHDSSFENVDSLKTWLSTHNTEIVYKLANPVITPITDQTLLAQLETLINMKTYKDITNIDLTGEDLAPILDCYYYQDMSTLNDRLDTLEARIELLEN